MKILAVDDELVSRAKLKKSIQSLGYEVLDAKDGKEGFELWERERARMVITDWLMPEMSGIELCKKIRQTERTPYTYIIMVTVKDGINNVVAGIDAGVDDFISKPFEKKELAARIRAGMRVLDSEKRLIETHNTMMMEIVNRKRAEEKLVGHRENLRKIMEQLQRVKETKDEVLFQLREALEQVKPFSRSELRCMNCQKIRDDAGCWTHMEFDSLSRADVEFSTGICPDCIREINLHIDSEVKTDEG